ncbi:unnamed protein product [Owenia fusiformis]|uniref:Uncharacterized protein n=1 Tax=Owenia fusiformis TaxID=6347 RepID=A0A8S4PFP1_OWEFU|nr:unnamed protein product [Owenia fusiformis]
MTRSAMRSNSAMSGLSGIPCSMMSLFTGPDNCERSRSRIQDIAIQTRQRLSTYNRPSSSTVAQDMEDMDSEALDDFLYCQGMNFRPVARICQGGSLFEKFQGGSFVTILVQKWPKSLKKCSEW